MKYKIGDLVVLSAAGRKNNHNPCFSRTGFGVITDYCVFDKYPIHIKWFTDKGKVLCFSAKQYEIKKLKPTKSK